MSAKSGINFATVMFTVLLIALVFRYAGIPANPWMTGLVVFKAVAIGLLFRFIMRQLRFAALYLRRRSDRRNRAAAAAMAG